MTLAQTIDRIEQDLILAALQQAGGNKSRAAQILSIKRTTLAEKIKRIGITPATEQLPANDDYIQAVIDYKRQQRQCELIKQLEAKRRENEQLLAQLERFNERKKCGNE